MSKVFISSLRYSIYKVQRAARSDLDMITHTLCIVKQFFQKITSFFQLFSSIFRGINAASQRRLWVYKCRSAQGIYETAQVLKADGNALQGFFHALKFQGQESIVSGIFQGLQALCHRHIAVANHRAF